MSTTRTYSVGANCGIRRLDNLTGPWVDVSRVPFTSASLFDVETDTVNADKVYTVGLTGTDSNGGAFYGILVSSDAGVTWNQPSALLGGNYTTLRTLSVPGTSFRFYEVSVVDANTIYASGDLGWVVKSTDGGQSFNKCTQLPPVQEYVGSLNPATLTAVTSVHFITPLIGVVGCGGNVFKTIDGGNSWSHLTSGPIAKNSADFGGIFTGIFISQDNQKIVALGRTFGNPARIFYSSNGGVTFSIVFVWSIEISGLHLTWTDDQHLWGFGEHQGRVYSLDGGATWNYYQIPSFSGVHDYAGHFYNNTDGFYSENKSIYQTLDGGNISKTLSEVSPFTVEALWTKLYSPSAPCYIIKDCEGIQPDFITNTDMSAYVGKTINTCINVDPDHKDNRVSGIPVPPGTLQRCYRFQNCCDPTETLFYQANSVDPVQWASLGGFAPNLFNQVVMFPGPHPGKCWKCTFSGDCGDPPPTVNNNPFPPQWYTFTTCENCLSSEIANPCLPPPPPDPEPTLYYYILTNCCNPLLQLIVTTGFIPNVIRPGAIQIPSIPQMGNFCWTTQPAPVGTPVTGAILINSNINTIYYYDNCDQSPCAPCQQTWPNGCYCATVEPAPNCIGSSPWLGVVNEVFDSCEDCKKKCYILRDCERILPDQIVANDFSTMVGQVIKIEECPNTCWEIIECEDCECDCVKIVTDTYISCEDCLPKPPPPPPVDLHPRRVKPGYYTPGCSPEYTEKVSCNFGDQMYNEMLIARYGLTICCEVDRIKWEIKKQLLDLRAIYDPSLCKCHFDCCPPTCVEASLQFFNSIPRVACPTPENVDASIS
jgi:photosystem II stability/assembly factor-like uncharacterized protein